MEIELDDGTTLHLDEGGELSDDQDSSFQSVGDGIFLRLTVTGETQMLGVSDGSANVLAVW